MNTLGAFLPGLRGLKTLRRLLFFSARVLVLAVLLAQPRVDAAALWISNSGGPLAEPSVKLVGVAPAKLVLEYQITGYLTEVLEREEGRFLSIELPGCGWTTTSGQPRLPVIRRFIEVPDGADIAPTVEADVETKDLAESGTPCYPVLPLQNPVPKIPKVASFVLDAAAYQRDAFVPASIVTLAEAGYFAGRRLVMVELIPIAYNPVQARLNIATRLTVTIQVSGGAKAATPLSSREETLLGRLALNHSPGPLSKSGGRLLVIAHTSFTGPELDAFVAHKQNLGWTVDLFDTSTAGSTTNTLKAFVQSRYNDPASRPDALLLVGDTPFIPQFIARSSDSPDTDIYYACMDAGDDWQPEFPVGRFSVVTTAQLADVVNKTIVYETVPPATWMSRAAFMASSDNFAITEGTHNYVIANYLQPRSMACDKLYCQTYHATKQQVTAAFNAGRVLAIYSGHGSITSWADGPVFTQSDVNSLGNAGKYPIVCSFACVTGDYSYGECFAETWQRAPDRGGVLIWASSVTSYWDEDDILEKKLFSAFYDHDLRAFGDATWTAKNLYMQYWGNISTTRRYFEQYNVFGDPTVELSEPPLFIASASPLTPACIDQPYTNTLAAFGGVRPYTWTITGGALPEGLTIDPVTGTIAGTPTLLGSATFVVQVTDILSSNASSQLDLPVVVPLEVNTPADLPHAILGQSYKVVLGAKGGTPTYVWSYRSSGAYAESFPPSVWLGDGVARGWHADDQSWFLSLPWPFPFYGTNRSSVWICSNGYVDFLSSSAEYSNSDEALITRARIAPLWDDLVTTGSGDDIFVATNANYLSIRWAAHTWADANPINAELVLFRDGSIQFNYDSAQSGFTPTVGVSSGDGAHYTLSIRNNANLIPASVSSQFTRTGILPPGLSVLGSGEISGTPTQAGTFRFALHVEDSGLPKQATDPEFLLNVIGVPSFSGVTFDGIDAVIRFNTEVGCTYALESCDDLAGAAWIVLGNNIPGTGSPVTILDPAAGIAPQRFYRLRSW
jgi:hypothetical protein